MLKIMLLEPDAKVPTCSRPGEDIGYDIYSLERVPISPNEVVKLRTGIAVSCYLPDPVTGRLTRPAGLLIKDRSSMASNGLFTLGGVIDSGYRGELHIVVAYISECLATKPFWVEKGMKIAQMIPTTIYTDDDTKIVNCIEDLGPTTRGTKGFGSSGIV